MGKIIRDHLRQLAQSHLDALCENLSGRRTGSENNREALLYYEDTLLKAGFEINRQTFDCMDWSHGEVKLTTEHHRFSAAAGPYSLGCDLTLPLCPISGFEALQHANLNNTILLLHDDLAREQLMPKNFPFYNPDHHKELYRLLEEKQPAAIISATSHNPALAGAVYPFPVIEDGDFDIPNVFMTDIEGRRLAAQKGNVIHLQFEAKRMPAVGWNVVGRRGATDRPRIVLTAHIDSKEGTPGALDNATGITIQLLLAQLLSDNDGDAAVELTAINGEDYYAASGERAYLEANKGRFGDILIGINLDGAGYKTGRTAYSFYGCTDTQKTVFRRAFAAESFMEGPEWYQSDHFLFIINERPAIALTSEHVDKLVSEIAHTAEDNVGQVAPLRLVETALALKNFINTFAI